MHPLPPRAWPNTPKVAIPEGPPRERTEPWETKPVAAPLDAHEIRRMEKEAELEAAVLVMGKGEDENGWERMIERMTWRMAKTFWKRFAVSFFN